MKKFLTWVSLGVIFVAGLYACITTMGVIGVCLGALLYTIFIMGSPSSAVKVVVIAALVLTTNPVGAHAIAKGA